MRYSIKFGSVFLLLLIASLSIAADGVISVNSTHSVEMTVSRLEQVLASKKMKVFAKIDHSQGAKDAGFTLRPSKLVIFGNPKVGTKLMQCSQTFAIDLPQKALIWEDVKGQVWLSYNDPEYLAARHGASECGPVIKKVKQALQGFADAATRVK